MDLSLTLPEPLPSYLLTSPCNRMHKEQNGNFLLYRSAKQRHFLFLVHAYT